MVDISVSTAYKHVKQTLNSLQLTSRELAEEVRDIDLARMDDMIYQLWGSRKNVKTAMAILRIMERRHKLVGAEAPSRITLGTSNAGLEGAEDLNHYTEEELLQMEMIMNEASKRVPLKALDPGDEVFPEDE